MHNSNSKDCREVEFETGEVQETPTPAEAPVTTPASRWLCVYFLHLLVIQSMYIYSPEHESSGDEDIEIDDPWYRIIIFIEFWVHVILATEIMYWCYVSPEQDWPSLEKKLQLCVSINFKCVIQPAPYFLQHILEKLYLNQHIIQRLLTLKGLNYQCPLMETK